MEGLLTDKLKKSLEEIVDYCFYANRKLDRMMSIISVKFVMTETEKILHPNLAHFYPEFSDFIVEYMSSRDCTTIYGDTPKGDANYESPKECFNEMLEINLELENKIKGLIKESNSEGDYSTMIFSKNALMKIISMTGVILNLVDKFEMYGDSPKDWMKFDHDIKDFLSFE